MPEWFKGPVLKTGEANYLRGFESLSIRYGNLGGLHKIPFLAVYCPLVPCFLGHDANQHKKAIPLHYPRFHPLPPCLMTHLMTLSLGDLNPCFLHSNPRFEKKKGLN